MFAPAPCRFDLSSPQVVTVVGGRTRGGMGWWTGGVFILQRRDSNQERQCQTLQLGGKEGKVSHINDVDKKRKGNKRDREGGGMAGVRWIWRCVVRECLCTAHG